MSKASEWRGGATKSSCRGAATSRDRSCSALPMPSPSPSPVASSSPSLGRSTSSRFAPQVRAFAAAAAPSVQFAARAIALAATVLLLMSAGNVDASASAAFVPSLRPIISIDAVGSSRGSPMLASSVQKSALAKSRGRVRTQEASGPSNSISSHDTTMTTTALFSTPRGNRPQPRRMLKKRPRRREKGGKVLQIPKGETDDFWETSESRPLAKAKAIEAGMDYWIDEDELQKSKERERGRIKYRSRASAEGEISKDKLRTEIVAPYKQNWIGWFSVGIVMIATIVTQFPELLHSPVIPIPDL